MLPSRSFLATRRILYAALAISTVVPLVLVTSYGYYDYHRRFADANDLVDRNSRVADEQALKVVDLNREMGARIVELLGEGDDMTLKDSEDVIHRRLETIGGAFAQVAAISVIGKNGALLASSKHYPVPSVSIEDREDFVAARNIRPEPYFLLPVLGKISQTDVFTTNMGRSSYDGTFLGLVSIALKREYFQSFYNELANDDASVNIALYRQDGGVLVQYPDTKPTPLGTASNSAFATALQHNAPFGQLQVVSSVDGLERVVAFRRVGDYPLYVASGYETHAITSQWREHFTFILLLTALPCLGIWLLVGFSLRRLEAEKKAWNSWQAEAVRREQAEASSRQLQRMGALGNLFAGIAHDFNNLLMVVSTNVALAASKRFTHVEREVRAVQRAALGAEPLARRLMSVTRKQPLKLETVDLSTWLPAVQNLIATALGGRVQLTLTVPHDIWKVCVDKTELDSAIVNIAVNAKDAMPNGGRFIVRCQNLQLSATDSLSLSGEYVALFCSDNGDGMNADVLRRAFEPLFTTKAQTASTGLRLAQVLAATEQAGGAARIESRAGKGTTVRLYLPRHHVKSTAQPTVHVPDTLKIVGETSVLLVEDNVEVAAGVSAVLEMLGCIVRHEVTADNAATILNGGMTFDLILSDIQMPGTMNGIDLAEHVRSTWPARKIALMTGYADEIDRAKHAGVKILAKPFDLDELETLVAESHG
ncbi:hybrid sensor histidine kinase/response regulator [Burkholderia sp. PAMC 26561]|uniref:hybrid sensor histidine kinase/response regulator n=1 Tax=Burkholderia sp. PAMC 26561 TaxID=1795043 RepID=UPI00076B808A|nr:hybrid sensor histidine kinase/response regulator [Burkholderia sp. PAMC 26561]AME23731.1 hybrid sensor histidine kinase/response regulator [Burkholderia sp. PAMC 26561]